MTGRRDKVKSKPGLRQAYRLGVFLLGLAFIGVGIGALVLPGPLTIPPILIGLWIWSTEFGWAQRFFDRWKEKAQDAWEKAKETPKRSAAITIFGLVAAGVTIWVVTKYQLVSKFSQFVGF